MDPFHPYNDPNNYGRDFDRPLERPDPGVNPNDFGWARDPQRAYQDRLLIERMMREQQAHHYMSQPPYPGSSTHSAASDIPLPSRPTVEKTAEPRPTFAELIKTAQEIGRQALEQLAQAKAPPETVVPERPVMLFFPTAASLAAMPARPVQFRPRVWGRRGQVEQRQCGWDPANPTQPYAIKDEHGRVRSQPQVNGWSLGRRIINATSSPQLRMDVLFGRGITEANLYLLPSYAHWRGSGLYLGPSNPVSSQQLHAYSVDVSVGELGMDVPDADVRSSKYAYDREVRSLERLEIELVRLLNKYGITYNMDDGRHHKKED